MDTQREFDSLLSALKPHVTEWIKTYTRPCLRIKLGGKISKVYGDRVDIDFGNNEILYNRPNLSEQTLVVGDKVLVYYHESLKSSYVAHKIL